MNLTYEYWKSIDMQPGIRPTPEGACANPDCSNGEVYAPTGRTYTTIDGELKEEYALQPCPVCRPDYCQTCGDRGAITYPVPPDDPRFGQLVPCPKQCKAARANQDEQRRKLVTMARLPDEYADCTFASFEAMPDEKRKGKMPAYYAARYFVEAAEGGHWVNRASVAMHFDRNDVPDDLRNWLVFYGEHGRGKTGMAVAIMQALLAEHRAVIYIRLQDFIDSVQNRYADKPPASVQQDGFGDATASEVIEIVRTSPVLVIDEFDVPDKSNNKESIIWKLVNYRYQHQLPTIVTTNLDDDGIEERWGLMVTSRMRHCAHWIPMRGPALRKQPGKFDFE